MVHTTKSKSLNYSQHILIRGLAGLAALYALGVGCESKEELIDSEKDAGLTLESCDVASSKCPSVCLDNDYYLCDPFEGEEGINVDVWKVSIKGEEISFLIDEGYLTMSSSQGNVELDTGISFLSVQSAGLPESGNFYHGIEARVKLDGSSSFTLGNGTNRCKIGSSNGAICGGYSIQETDYYEAKVKDVSEWHTYHMGTGKALDGSGKVEGALYQDGKKIMDLEIQNESSIKYSKFTTDINCWLPEIGSCTFDYVRARVTDQNKW
ncbi:hypothetical protein HY636_03215 [Candidatus Woesearchaeota archaeon]|nr:hypothetical protein [Candidatus Woesearchaeota archaeon]